MGAWVLLNGSFDKGTLTGVEEGAGAGSAPFDGADLVGMGSGSEIGIAVARACNQILVKPLIGAVDFTVEMVAEAFICRGSCPGQGDRSAVDFSGEVSRRWADKDP